MGYNTIPLFNNKDYKSDIKEKVFDPLINQHNMHSDALSNLGELPANASSLNSLAERHDSLKSLSDVDKDLLKLSVNSQKLGDIGNNGDVILGLDKRVTRLELSDPMGPPGDVDLSHINKKLEEHSQLLVDLDNEIEATKPLVNKNTLDIEGHEGRIITLEKAPGGGVPPELINQIDGNSAAIQGHSDRLSTLENIKHVTKFVELEDTVKDLSVGKDKLLGVDSHGIGMKFYTRVHNISDLNNVGDLTGHAGKFLKVDSASKNIEFAEAPAGSKPSAPTKFYVLPMGGQSNCEGWGERGRGPGYDINSADDAPDPRIFQLGRSSFSKAQTGYGDLHDTLRPYSDCNLKIIPATPCLDHVFESMASKTGGFVGPGLYIAKKLLPYIPSDYGILIVPSARGSSGFRHTSDKGWNAVTKRADKGNQSWRVGLPLSKDLFERTKHALNLNPNNRLLPIVWVQGEDDDSGHKVHLEEFEKLFNWFKDNLVSSNLTNRLPNGDIRNFRWICGGPTKWAHAIKNSDDYINSKVNMFDWGNRWGAYNNYIYLSSKSKQRDGDSQIVYVRLDIDSEGNFSETGEYYGEGVGWSGYEYIHFSPEGFRNSVSESLANAILRYGKVAGGYRMGLNHRKVWGGVGKVFTDNCTFSQEFTPDFSRLNENLLIHQDFNDQAGGITKNQITSSASISGGSGFEFVADSEFGKVVRSKESGNTLKYSLSKGESSYTKSFVVSSDAKQLGVVSNVCSLLACPDNEQSNGVMGFCGGNFYIFPDWTRATTGADGSEQPNRGGPRQSVFYSPAVEGNWRGEYSDWQHVAVTYEKATKLMSVYWNGNLVRTSKITTQHVLNINTLGGYDNISSYQGKIAVSRIYDRVLSQSEIQGLTYSDLLSKVKSK